MPGHPCTVGALKRVFESDIPPDQVVPNPVFQVLQIKPIAAQPNAPERYRIVFSDTENFIQSMLATQANYLVLSKELEKGCFVRLLAYQANQVKEKKILIVLGLEVLKEHGKREKIGNPVSLEQDPATRGPATSTGNSAAPPQQASATAFYGNKPAAAPAPQRAAAQKPSSRPGATGHDRIYPIESLSPYQNKWTIKARVTSKSEIKTWQNQKGEGRLFTVNLLDESGEIRATGFNDQVDSLYELFQEGQVYYISKCRVGMAKRQFSNISNDYELSFERDTEVERCTDVDDSVPQVRFSFIQFADLESVQKDAMIDVIGVIKEVGDLGTVTSKVSQKPYSKRELTLVDKTNYLVRCTVWGKVAESWEMSQDEIVAFKGVKVSDFGGRSLSMLHSSTMSANPDIDEAHILRGWYDGQGRGETFQSHQGLSGMGAAGGGKEDVKNLAQIGEDNFGMGEKPDYFTTKATIVYIKQDSISYPACLSETCNKKVVPVDGGWRCERCDVTHPKPQYRYIMTISCNDAFGQAWLSCFDDVGRMIMGKTADELHELSDPDGMTENRAYTNVFSEANCKTYSFKCRAKLDTYDGQQRVRFQVMSASPVNYAVEAARLVEQIKLYSMN
ncbi:uncharacterized protein H6S33_005485 [Morchella sextelata]|uniref:uncharacterized protein n=1 Tax=Morchella sextelata TaxID=1174677 RepID=UPI001D041924|nr:uncharacterized protein H6S33_005485 [Morchella sextelata]KAH0613599.1 hypothetical protein H6S33_005485 [Morchella sextelata]